MTFVTLLPALLGDPIEIWMGLFYLVSVNSSTLHGSRPSQQLFNQDGVQGVYLQK